MKAVIRTAWAALAFVTLLRGQAPLENSGAPLKLPFECSEEDSQLAGLTCSDEEPCPVYLELSGVESVGNKLFLVGNVHTSSATLYSVLLASDDSGKTWTEPQPRMRFTAFEQIQFASFELGWISGENVQGVPRDPFFLVTDDGGKSWRQRHVFDESRAGVIERFWFDSPTNGTMLIDTRLNNRHELYETQTGGSSWSLRMAGTVPIAFPRGRNPRDAAWRIRADAKSSSYQIEKRTGEKWQPVAAFLVDVGKCRR